MKTCTNCSETKQLKDFWPEKRNLDGHRNVCAVCSNSMRRASIASRRIRERTTPARWVLAISLKICTSCGGAKSTSEYHKHPGTHDGYRGQCKTCRLKTQKKFSQRTSKTRVEYTRQWRLNNPEWYKRLQRENYEKTLPIRLARNTAWNKANPEKVREYARIMRKRRPEVYKARKAKRRAAEFNATPSWYEKKRVLHVYAKASEFGFQVDHIVPLQSDIVCGLHCHDNLQLLDASINQSKSNRHWPDMPEAV